jgi:hypothetical protein
MDIAGASASKREFLLKLVLAEVLARPGEGPLARRSFATRMPPPPVATPADAGHPEQEPSK